MNDKPFALFAGHIYYANGGFGDYIDSFESPEQAFQHFELNTESSYWEWFEIVDLRTKQIVRTNYS